MLAQPGWRAFDPTVRHFEASDFVNLPHIQLYQGDWLKDPVAGCGLAAQGLWLRLMFVMQESPHRGFLCLPPDEILPDFCLGKHGGKLKPLPDSYLARRAGTDLLQYQELFKELWIVGVPSKTESGVIYSRRMVRDEALRKIRSEAGMKGAKATLLRQNNGSYSNFASAKEAANPDNAIDNDNGTGRGTGGRKKWQIKKDREIVQERIKEVRIQAGQNFNGQAWEGKVSAELRLKIDDLKNQDRILQEEFDKAPA